uniref:Uncharacterized protein n=1 Tax=Anguilla anguilla TaxID=7936 RepID=A0A0E9Q750_ANGAN
MLKCILIFRCFQFPSLSCSCWPTFFISVRFGSCSQTRLRVVLAFSEV